MYTPFILQGLHHNCLIAYFSTLRAVFLVCIANFNLYRNHQKIFENVYSSQEGLGGSIFFKINETFYNVFLSYCTSIPNILLLLFIPR